MSLEKRGTHHTSFSYLEKDRDYKAFALAAEVGRVPSSLVPLTAGEEGRVEAIVRENVMISMHEHLGVFPDDVSQTPAYVREGRMATAFRGLAASYWDAIFDNLMDGICTIESQGGWKWTEVLHDLGMRLCDLAHQDFVVLCSGVDDIVRAHDEGRIAWVAAMEGAAMIENEIDRIDILYGFGVRSMGITYSEGNALGAGLKEPGDAGLTMLGRRAVERMNKVGMLIDCSHCGDRTALDVIAASEQPIAISHIGARALWDTARMAPDEVLEACAAKGGLIGVEAAPHTTLTVRHPAHSIESFMEHFVYIKNLVGIDHVTFGPDTLYGDHVGLHAAYAAHLSIDAATAPRDGAVGKIPVFERVKHVRGLENPTECSHNIVRWLVKNGHTDDEIVKVIGGNALRVLRQVWC